MKMVLKTKMCPLFLGTLLSLHLILPYCLATSSLLTNKTPTNIINQYLTPHNKIRAKLHLPPLQWSEQLANFARWWAHQRRGDCAMIHSQSGYGENLFWGSTGRYWGPRDAVAFWASERSYYDYNSNSCDGGRECLHYTQIIWRHSLRVGCAKVICNNGYTFIGCNYDPHGNILGQRPF
ncbi:hypothetical protein vseg_002934 [Gypsophila vaccaria]